MENGSSTSKIILSTALKTVAVILLVSVLAFLIVGIISPMMLGDLLYDLGAPALSVRYTLSGYQASEDVNDLSKLISRAIESGAHEIVTEFAPIMLAHRDYRALCTHYDGLLSGNYDLALSYDRYLRGNYVLSLAKLSRASEALALVTGYMHFDYANYTYHGIGNYFILSGCESRPSETAVTAFLAKAVSVKEEIDGLIAVETEEGTLALLSSAKLSLYSDISGILTLIGENADAWSSL